MGCCCMLVYLERQDRQFWLIFRHQTRYRSSHTVATRTWTLSLCTIWWSLRVQCSLQLSMVTVSKCSQTSRASSARNTARTIMLCASRITEVSHRIDSSIPHRTISTNRSQILLIVYAKSSVRRTYSSTRCLYAETRNSEPKCIKASNNQILHLVSVSFMIYLLR